MFSRDVEAYRYAHFGKGSGPIIIDELECYGTELDIAACGSNKWLNSDCDHSEDAGVKCGGRVTAMRIIKLNLFPVPVRYR